MKRSSHAQPSSARPVKFFHEISDTQWQFMKLRGDRWGDVRKEYAPPTWCTYPHAVDPMGCWSLVGRMVTGEDYCRGCDLHKDHPDNAKWRGLS